MRGSSRKHQLASAVGIDAGIDPADITHRAMDDKATFHLAVVLTHEEIERVERPVRDLAAAGALRRTERSDELVRERRPVGAVPVIDIERDVALVGPKLIADRGINRLGRRFRAAQMCRNEDDAVRRRQIGLRQIIRIASGRG